MSELKLSDIQLALAIAQGSLNAWRGAFPDNTPDEIKAPIHALEKELAAAEKNLADWRVAHDLFESARNAKLKEQLLAHQNALKEAKVALEYSKEILTCHEFDHSARKALSTINSVLGDAKS